MFPWQTQLFVARPRPIRRREFHVCHERYAILMSQGKTYARVLRLLLELAFTSGRDEKSFRGGPADAPERPESNGFKAAFTD